MAPVVTIGGRKVFVVPELPTLKTHEPIFISGNDNFITANGVVSGSGTSTDPYIIENWDIRGDGRGIEMRDTDAYFIIRNCSVHNSVGYIGIYLYNITNGKINNVSSYENHSGVWMNRSSMNTITDCDIYNNSAGGVYIVESPNIEIHYNNIYNNGDFELHTTTVEKYGVDARNNWWGNPDGPGDRVRGKVIIEPWLRDKRGN